MGSRKSVSMALLIVLILVFSTLTAGIGSAYHGDLPAIYNVGNGYYDTVAEAVWKAQDGDLILIGPGDYNDPVLIDKELTIIGNDEVTVTSTWFVTAATTIKDTTFEDIIDTDWNKAAGVTTMWVPYDTSRSTPISNVVVTNCIFKNCQHGVYLFGAKSCTVEDSTFDDCYRGVSIQDHMIGTYTFRASSYNTVQDCTFTNLKPLNDCEGEAVAINRGDYNLVQRNYVDGAEWGVHIALGDYNTIKENEFVNITNAALTFESISTKVTVTKNTIRDCDRGVSFKSCKGFEFTENTIENSSKDNLFSRSSSFKVENNIFNGSGLYLDQSVSGTFTNNVINITDGAALNISATGMGHYAHTIGTDNTVGGNPIHYFYNQDHPSVTDTTSALVVFAYCQNPNVTSTEVIDGDGIRIVNSPYANITDTNVTNGFFGIDINNSLDGTVDGCNINGSSRGIYGIRVADSLGHNTSNTNILVNNGIPAWQIEGGDIYSCYNTSFPDRAVDAKKNGGGELKVFSALTVRVMENDTVFPLAGVETQLTENSHTLYSTTHFGGTDPTTDASGRIGPITVLDREYKSHFIPIEHDHDLDLWFGADAIWSKALYSLNMSVDKFILIETTDVWKPAMPANFTVTDIPAEDALKASWDLNIDDTVSYAIWSNVSGDWELLENLTATTNEYRIDQGLVHGGKYYFLVSAWDEVPLESDRTEALMVDHVDGLAPATITGFLAPEATVNGTDITLIWDANSDSDLEGYRVYINEVGGSASGPWVLLTTMTGFMATTLWVKGLASETTYHFIVTAVDERPNESEFSQVVTVMTDDITPPDAPVLGALPEWTNIKARKISGTAEPGSTVTILLNNEIVDEVVAGGDGAFSVSVDLKNGLNVFTAVATDPSGNVGSISAQVSTTLDQDAPNPPVLDLLPQLTNVVGHTISGTAEPQSVVTILLSGEVLGTVTADGDGAFELPVTLEEGLNTVTAFATDAAMNDGTRATVQNIILDTIAPDVPTVGELPEYTNEEDLVVSGEAEPGSFVEIMDGPDLIGSLTAASDGSYSETIYLIDRETVITVRATDDAQNVGGKTIAKTVILDQEAPDAVAGEDIEAVQETEVTFDGGESSDNEGIASYVWTFELDGTPMSIEGASATHTFPDPVTLTVTLTVTDLAGNSAEDSLALTIIPDNLPPILRRDEMSPGKGSTDTKFEFSVEFKDPDGDNGEVWIFIDGESFLMTPDPDDTDTTDGQRYTYKTKLGKGDHTYYFTGKDSFGNDAGGPSAGEDNAKASPDIEDKKVSDTPGAVAILAAMAMLTAVALAQLIRPSRRRR